MSAGEVERLVSDLSGGTGGDEEEEWLYGGTELPVPSSRCFPGLRASPGLPGRGLRGEGGAWAFAPALPQATELAGPEFTSAPRPPPCTHMLLPARCSSFGGLVSALQPEKRCPSQALVACMQDRPPCPTPSEPLRYRMLFLSV